ncbi:unnamed protein product [Strongylus vulgaris]|uniref:Uncharacterized protein n=1 Tax=Strongylus vulgaris TaxID=40348 RepID=A0A3P7L3T7_STRVU|nr:unnamed protein product [Strongylus vulgaris]
MSPVIWFLLIFYAPPSEYRADHFNKCIVGPSYVDERSLSPEPTGPTKMRDDTSPAEYDAIARAPHLTASQLHGMLQIDAFASKYSHLAKVDDIGMVSINITRAPP